MCYVYHPGVITPITSANTYYQQHYHIDLYTVFKPTDIPFKCYYFKLTYE